MIELVPETIKVAKRSRDMGRHPFGAILVQNGTDKILMQHTNVGSTPFNFTPEHLSRCTLYTSVEPCAMCAGTCYWATIGTVVYGMPETELASLTTNSKENLTMELPCREVFVRGSRKVNVIGPFPELYDEIKADYLDFWDSH